MLGLTEWHASREVLFLSAYHLEGSDSILERILEQGLRRMLPKECRPNDLL
jgi:hypothetical protein